MVDWLVFLGFGIVGVLDHNLLMEVTLSGALIGGVCVATVGAGFTVHGGTLGSQRLQNSRH